MLPGHERGLEEREALDVIPVHVAEEHVRRDGHLFMSFLPSRRRPVPPSKMRSALPARTSTQLVLPPISTVSGPGVGMLPRTPQNVMCIFLSLSLPCRVDTVTSVPRWREEGYSLSSCEGSSPTCRIRLLEAPGRALPTARPPAAIVVLGCRRGSTATGASPPGRSRGASSWGLALTRSGATRTPSSSRAVGGAGATPSEADAMARELARLGVPDAGDRARALLALHARKRAVHRGGARRGGSGASTVVTCAWHMARAVALRARGARGRAVVPGAEEPASASGAGVSSARDAGASRR